MTVETGNTTGSGGGGGPSSVAGAGGVAPPVCGDGVCDEGEAVAGCVADCGAPKEQRLFASDAAPGMSFGASVATDGETILVGAPTNPWDPETHPAAYVFVRMETGWIEQAKLAPDDDVRAFGWSVAVDGNTAVVADPLEHRVYVYERAGTSWNETQILTSSHPGDCVESFGHSVALDGETLAVGATTSSAEIECMGRNGDAHVFVRVTDGWQQQAVLEPSLWGQQFGYSLSMSGELVAVGAPDLNNGVESCEVGLFERTEGTWHEVEVWPGALSDDDAVWGSEVSLSGRTLAVGSWVLSSGETPWPGFLTILGAEDSSWSLQDEFVGVGYGLVRVDGDWVAATAPGGVALLHRAAGGWSLVTMLTPAIGSGLGGRLALSGATLVVGAGDDSSAGENAGGAWVVDLSEEMSR